MSSPNDTLGPTLQSGDPHLEVSNPKSDFQDTSDILKFPAHPRCPCDSLWFWNFGLALPGAGRAVSSACGMQSTPSIRWLPSLSHPLAFLSRSGKELISATGSAEAKARQGIEVLSPRVPSPQLNVCTVPSPGKERWRPSDVGLRRKDSRRNSEVCLG